MSTTEERLKARFGAAHVEASRFRDNVRFDIPPATVFEALTFLKGECGFDLLAELTAADLLEYPNARDRFRVLYVLVNTATRRADQRPHARQRPRPDSPVGGSAVARGQLAGA